MDEQKRILLAMVLSGLILLTYWVFVAEPQRQAALAERQAQIALQAENAPKVTPETNTAPVQRSREELIHEGVRIPIETPSIKGSFQTQGSRFDDLRLKNYKQTIEPGSEDVILLTPEGTEKSSYIFDNWVTNGASTGTDIPWQLVSGTSLTPDSPITLEHRDDNFTVKRVISVDDQYLITLDDSLTNTSGSEISVIRKGAARQHDLPDDLTNFFIIQEGPIAIVDNTKTDMKYKKLSKKREESLSGGSGWVGLTDRYWLTAAIAPQGQQMSADFRFKNLNGQDVYEAGYQLAPTIVTPGTTIQSKGYIYAGAKVHNALDGYTDKLNIARLDLAIDYGLLGILTKPMSRGLTLLGEKTGNFGVGILLMTLLLKLILFPLNNKAYASMAKMKLVQPKIKKLQNRYGDDRVKMQQEMMALYRKEGVNPLAGCLPMIPQIFIFFALYKSLFITLEMRHAPFYGWIKDLSAKDPLSILNGFGLFPWDAVPVAALSFFAIGPLALLYGITMAMMQTLNTPPTDKMQARIMQLMPLMFMFILAPFAAGLLLYWVWNNILSLIQQYIITRKYKVETPMDKFIAKLTGKASATANDK